MAIGMSADEFWHGDFKLAPAYREADKIKRERQQADQWTIGAYVQEAIAATAHAINPFAKKKMHDYPDKPYGWDEQGESDSQDIMAANVQAFEALAINHNAAVKRRMDNEG